MDVFDLCATISIKMDEFDRGIEAAKSKFESFSSGLKSVGEKVSDVGTALTKSVSTPLLNVGKNMLQAGMDYEAGMDEVQAISGATGTEIDALGKKAMEMAAKTKFSTAESAEAYKYMAMAGWKTNDMLNSLSSVMYLAGASGESLGATSDIVTDAMTAFGLAADENSKVLKNGYEVEVSNAQRFTDVLAAASNNANTNVSMLGESFKYIAPVAGAMGYSIEDTSIALGLMANNGVKAGMGGTALRNILTNLAKPTDQVQTAMEQLGISLADNEGNMYSLMDVMKQFRAAFAGGQIDMEAYKAGVDEYNRLMDEGELTVHEYNVGLDNLAISLLGVEDAEKASYAATVAGKYGMAGLLSIVGASDKDFNTLTEAIYNSNGATEEMYSIMTDNAQGAVTMLDSAINVLYTTLSQHIIPIFTEIVRKITDVVNWFAQLDEGTQKLILTIGGIAIAAGPVLTVVGNIITAIGTVGSAIGGLITTITNVGTAVSGLFAVLAANPIVLVIAAVAALTAGLIYLWNTNEGFRDAVGEIWEAITGFFTSAVEAIKTAWEGVGEFFAGIWERISSAFEGVADFFGGIFENAAAAVQSAWEAVVGFFEGIWEGIQDVFSSVADTLGGFFEDAAAAVHSAWEAITTFFSGIWQGIQDVFSSVADVLGGFFSDAAAAVQSAWDAVVGFFSGVWADIQGVFSNVASVLGGFFSDAWAAVQGAWDKAKTFFSDIAEGIHSKFEEVTSFLSGAFEDAWSAVQSAWETAVSFFQGVWDGISGAFSDAAGWFGNIFEQARSAVEGAWDGISEFFGGIWEKITGVFKDVGAKFKEIGGNIVNGLKDGITGAWDAFTGWIGSKVGGLVDAVKGMLGIHSPSKVFAGIGGNMALGLKVGWEDEYSDIKRTIENGMDFGVVDISTRANTVYNGSFGNSSGSAAQQITNRGGDTYNFYSPEPLDPVSAAREMKKAKQQMALNYV